MLHASSLAPPQIPRFADISIMSSLSLFPVPLSLLAPLFAATTSTTTPNLTGRCTWGAWRLVRPC